MTLAREKSGTLAKTVGQRRCCAYRSRSPQKAVRAVLAATASVEVTGQVWIAAVFNKQRNIVRQRSTGAQARQISHLEPVDG